MQEGLVDFHVALDARCILAIEREIIHSIAAEEYVFYTTTLMAM